MVKYTLYRYYSGHGFEGGADNYTLPLEQLMLLANDILEQETALDAVVVVNTDTNKVAAHVARRSNLSIDVPKFGPPDWLK